MPHESRLRLVSLYPDLLGTYGDVGNLQVLEARARWRGIEVETTVVHRQDPAPAGGDIYLLGGGEDLAQEGAADRLRRNPGIGFRRAVDAGAAVFAVCAGYQVLGQTYTDAHGGALPGLGLLDVTTDRGTPRAVGEMLAQPVGLELPTLTGYENHGGRTTLGPDAVPLGRTLVGIGNSEAQGTDGVRRGRVVGTYLHGPALARNPALADLLLNWVVGTLPPLDDELVEQLRRERLAAVHGRRGGVRRWSRSRASVARTPG